MIKEENNIVSYIRNFINYDNHLLKEIEKEKTIANNFSFIEPEVGKFISFIIRISKAKKVLELGTCVGYSTIWIGEAVKTNKGKLISIEKKKELATLATSNVKKAGLEKIVEILNDDALNIVEIFDENFFDLIFIDTKKSLYPTLIPKIKKILKKNGILIADDTLFSEKKMKKEISIHTDKYNELIFTDSDFYSTIINIGDGITLSIKE